MGWHGRERKIPCPRLIYLSEPNERLRQNFTVGPRWAEQPLVPRLAPRQSVSQIDAVSHRNLLIALGAGLLGGALVWFYYARYAPTVWSDFDQIWLAGRALLDGRDPYLSVPAGGFPWPFYYPLPAALLGLPFAPLSLLHGRVVFAALTAGICTAAILHHRPQAWSMLISAPFLYGLIRGQWAPLLVASALVPWMGGLAITKPSIGLAIFASRPTRQAVIGGLVLLVVSLALRPSWPLTWFATIRGAPHLIVPALMPAGAVLLAALARWERADGRLLGVLSCVPQTSGIYELFPLALVPASSRQAMTLTLSWNILYLVTLATHSSAPITFADAIRGVKPIYWPPTLLLGYLPALAMVLWPLPILHRPTLFAAWPAWRQRAYVIGWTSVLLIVLIVSLGWAWLVWGTWIRPSLSSLAAG
jgi:hypothetical protein